MWALGALFVAGCAETEKATTDSGLVKSNFQTEVGGKKTDLYVLRNQNNMEVCVTNFGGRIVSVMVPDKEGVMRDVVLGFDSIQDYISKPSDFGASIGRYANRINQGNLPRRLLKDKSTQVPAVPPAWHRIPDIGILSDHRAGNVSSYCAATGIQLHLK